MESATLDFVSIHAPGMAGVGYAGQSDRLKLISCGQDGQLCTQKADDLSDKVTKSLQADAVACHCLAVSPLQDNFAVGDQAHFVKVCRCICDEKLSIFGKCSSQVHRVSIPACADLQASRWHLQQCSDQIQSASACSCIQPKWN